MTMSAAVPTDHPLMKAWTAYKESDEFANARRWAAHGEHLDGSLWAAFMAGWTSAAAGQAARVEELEREVVAVLEIIPGAVRVREGGANENIAASLAVSVAKLIARLEEGKS